MANEILKGNQVEKKETSETPEFLFEKFKNRNDISLIFLKGGGHGGLNPDVKKELIARLSQWFDIFEGQEKELAFEEIATRWGAGYLKYPALDVMRENSNFGQDFLKQGELCLADEDEKGFQEWLAQAKKIAGEDVGLLRIEMLMAYYASGGQNVLLRLKEGVTREKIFEDLGLDNSETLEKAVGREKVNAEWLNAGKVSLQEFVKRFVVGNTTAHRAMPGTLRFIISEKMKERKLIPCAELWKNSSDQWSLKNKIQDSKLVASNLLNAIHAAGSLEELELEVNLLSRDDLQKFSKILN